jgi:eukaryotic-like serine/threonine-protein kinase
MTKRRRVFLLLLAGASFAVLAADLGFIGASGWLKVVVTAVVAISLFAVGVMQALAGSALGYGSPQPPALPSSIFAPGRKPPKVKAMTNPVSLGVHSAPEPPPGAARIPPYIPRDIDPALRNALGGSGFVLVVGDAAAGKTRTAYEAMRAVLPDHVLIAPAGSGDCMAALSAARAERNCVLWLDSMQRFLGADAITGRRIAELLAGARHHRVVIATLRATEETRLLHIAGSLPDGQLTRGGQAVLDQVTNRIALNRLFSESERARTARLGRDDQRLADALGHADRYGVAEYLSNGPQLRNEWLDGWERGSHPRGAALIAAAVDCRRAGYTAVLPRTLLNELHEYYLQGRGGSILRPESLEAAWTWATGLRDGGNSPLWPAGEDHCEVFDYLVDTTERESSLPVAEQTVRVALRYCRAGDAVSMAAIAWYQGRRELAEAGFRTAYAELRDTEGPDAPATLSSRSDLAVTLHAMRRLPDAETEYRAILAARTASLGARHPDTLSSRNNLAVVLHEQGRVLGDHGMLSEAESEYRNVLEIRAGMLGREHPDTLTSRNNLGVALRDLGRLDEAEVQLDETVRLRVQVLGAEHVDTIVSQKNLSSVRSRRLGL